MNVLAACFALVVVPHAAPQSAAQSVSPDTAQAIAFLEFVKSGEDDAARKRGFDVASGGYWNNQHLLRLLDPAGVTFSDVNGDTTWHLSLARIRYQFTRRSGAAFKMMVHLAHIYAQPEPDYSKLTFADTGQNVVVNVGGWYRVTFVRVGQKLRVTRVEYVMKEEK